MPSDWSIRQYILFENLKKFRVFVNSCEITFYSKWGVYIQFFLQKKLGNWFLSEKKHFAGVPQCFTISWIEKIPLFHPPLKWVFIYCLYKCFWFFQKIEEEFWKSWKKYKKIIFLVFGDFSKKSFISSFFKFFEKFRILINV